MKSVVRLALVCLILLGLSSTWAWALDVLEPAGGNNTCDTAQDLGALPAAGIFTGFLDANDIDFYTFAGTPGQEYDVAVNTSRSPYLFVRNLAWFARVDGVCTLVRGTGPVNYGMPQMKVTVPADGILILAVTGDPDPDYDGTHANFGYYDILGLMTPVNYRTTIIGRVVDKQTGLGLPGTTPPFVTVGLEKCEWYGCYQLLSTRTDTQGYFRFEGAFFGNFQVVVTSSTEYVQPIRIPANAFVTVAAGQSHDFGTIGLARLVPVDSISGQVVDSVTGRPLAGDAEPYTWVELQRHNPGTGWYESVATAAADAQGRYEFRTGYAGPLIPGDFQLIAHANQYQELGNWIELLALAGGEVRKAPALQLLSNPVRFSGVVPCSTIPGSGGKCAFSVKVTNGTALPKEGVLWMLVTGSDTGGFVNATEFQACRRELDLPSARVWQDSTRTVSCDFKVPAGVPDYATFCATARYGEGTSNPMLNVQGLTDLFCIQKLPGVPMSVLPARKAHELMREGRKRDH